MKTDNSFGKRIVAAGVGLALAGALPGAPVVQALTANAYADALAGAGMAAMEQTASGEDAATTTDTTATTTDGNAGLDSASSGDAQEVAGATEQAGSAPAGEAGDATVASDAAANAAAPGETAAGDSANAEMATATQSDQTDQAPTLQYKPGQKFLYKQYTCIVNPDGTSVTIGLAQAVRGWSVTIPGTIEGYTVTALADAACYGQDTIGVFILPDTLESIGAEAFMDCKKLTKIDIPEGVSSIGDNAFAGTGISSLILPSGLRELGRGICANCKKLYYAALPNDLAVLPEETFSGCKRMEALVVGTDPYHGPNDLRLIESNAFAGCKMFNEVSYYYGSTVEDEQASWEAVQIEEGNEVLENAAVRYVETKSHKYRYTKLAAGATFTLEGIVYKVRAGQQAQVSVSKYKRNAATVKLAKKVVNNGVTYRVSAVGAKAFKGKSKLKKVALSSGITSVGKKAFASCTKLKRIEIKGKKLAKVGKSAFKNINAKATFKMPTSKKAAYKKLLKKAGAPKGARYKSA